MFNKKLLPLKVTLFGYAGAAFSVLPYLTIHMKDIGIRQEAHQLASPQHFYFKRFGRCLHLQHSTLLRVSGPSPGWVPG